MAAESRTRARHADASAFTVLSKVSSALEPDPRVRRYDDVRQLLPDPSNPTPLVRLNRVLPPGPLSMFLKLEWLNPFGSIKDRTAAYLLEGLRRRGEIDGKDLVEPSSGNTGIALAALAALEGRRLVVTIPDGVPEEKKVILRMLGAEVWPTPDDLCPVNHPKDGAIALARALAASGGGKRFTMPNQYENPDNVRAHYETTGPEIWRQTEGRIRYFFAGFGTCGTLVGVGRFLKERDSSIRIVAVEPQRGHRLPGLKSFEEAQRPAILDMSVIDDIVRVEDEPAYAMTKRLFREEGLIVGPSTGAIVEGAARLGGNPDGLAVGVSPDGGARYASYFVEWLGAEGDPGATTPEEGSEEDR
jgi:cysteine synthase